MKRNENLKTLSWEHHHGLVAAFRLQQGLNNDTTKEILRDYVLFVWENDLDQHFRKEEEVIETYSLNKNDGRKIVGQMECDHQNFRKLINIFKRDNYNPEHIRSFADLLNKHIRFEERQLFPYIEAETSQKNMERIGVYLEEHYTPSCSEWQHQFWAKPVSE
jgi:iron-sulfur cluster repair protein YtfE (RIC family)